jgi:hypothetical protein
MKMKPLRILSMILFYFGIILGFLLATITIWENVEALNYFFKGASYAPFQGLDCPRLLTRSETGVITSVFDNPTDTEDNFSYKIEIGNVVSPRIIADQIVVPAHQTKSVALTVNKDDIDLQFFIFAKITISPNAFRPTRVASCGIMVINNRILNGKQIFAIALALSLLGIVFGLGLWERTGQNTDSNANRLMRTLALVVLLAMFAGLIGWWLAGTTLVVITMLLFLISMRFAFA